MTQVTTWESYKNTRKLHIQESPFPASDHKVAMNKHKSMTNTNINNKNDPQKKHSLGTFSENILMEGLN